ncbi:MAG: type II secretion system F family protein [Candidatus Omnitrophota bacterium]
MANFKYRSRDKFSRQVTGAIEASSADEAAKKLNDMGYLPISIEAAHNLSAQSFLTRFKAVKLNELSAFTRQLYSLQKAGLPLLSGLTAIAEQAKNNYFRLIINEVSRDIKEGMSFSQALKKHPRVFDEVFVSMVRAAEAGGSLVEILSRLNLLIEQKMDTQNRIKAATRYPLIALSVLCLGFLIVVTFVIPRFASIYSQFNAALPLPTQALIAINLAFKKYWYLFILGIGITLSAFFRFIRSAYGRTVWDNFKLRTPVFGALTTMLIMSRFARVTATLMKSGVSILEVLDLSGRTCGNVIISRAVSNIKESVSQGRGLSEPMKVSGLFPPVVTQMVSVGEQSGKVDDLLLSVADYYDLESGYTIRNLTTYIEPLLILILAVMVLIMALAIFLPMWNLIKVFKPA